MARPADPNARHALLTAARAEFVKAGIRGARIEDITAACGLSKGAFYLHSPSKEALFGEMAAQLQGELEAVLSRRHQRWSQFITEHGPLKPSDVTSNSKHYRATTDLEASLDRELLELIWRNRDLFEILVSGSQGTEFSGLIWAMVDRETDNLTSSVEMLQKAGSCRPDLPPRLFASVLVGSWLLIARQLALLKQQPDLEQWVRALHRLFREGSMSSPPASPTTRRAKRKSNTHRPEAHR